MDGEGINEFKGKTIDTIMPIYIKTFLGPLRKEGFTNIYFLVISCSFDTGFMTALRNIKMETQVPTVFLTSRLLFNYYHAKLKHNVLLT